MTTQTDSNVTNNSTGPDQTDPPANGTRPPSAQDENRADPKDATAHAALPSALKAIASVVAPGTIVTALMIYFGLLYTVGYYRHFGVNYTVLELPVQDYLILSADAAVVPLACVAAATLLSLWLYHLPLRRLPSRIRPLACRTLAPALLLMGLALLGSVLLDVAWGIDMYPDGFWEARGLSLAAGVLVLAYGLHVHKELSPRKAAQDGTAIGQAVAVGKLTAITILVGIGLFWAIGSYGIAVGAGTAEGISAALPCQPDVTLYTEKSVGLQAPGMQKEALTEPDAQYKYRYSGLKLLPQSGPWYVFLSKNWTPVNSPAILLRRTDAIRLEFTPSSEQSTGQC